MGWCWVLGKEEKGKKRGKRGTAVDGKGLELKYLSWLYVKTPRTPRPTTSSTPQILLSPLPVYIGKHSACNGHTVGGGEQRAGAEGVERVVQ